MLLLNNERVVKFIHSLEPDRSPLLERIRREASAAAVPIIRDETAALLKCLIRIRAPKSILEIGTAVGYSALCMAEAMPEDAGIWTIESYESRVLKARSNFLESGYSSQIELIDGDAGEALRGFKKASREFDFVFLDAAKAQYPVWLPDILELMSPGGVLVSDNILQEGTLADSRYSIPRRDRTIHERLREYLYAIKHNDMLESAVLPIGDGVSVSVKKG